MTYEEERLLMYVLDAEVKKHFVVSQSGFKP
jgi:hypothetical protein